MAHYSVLLIHILLVSSHSLTSGNQYFETPGTEIREAVPLDNTISNDERGDQNLPEDSSGTCPESKNFVRESSMEDQLLPEYMSLNYPIPNPDPYLRATFRKGQYYPYSVYDVYNKYYNDLPGKPASYNDMWYPYTNPSATSVPYANIPPVNSLPPVYQTLYGKTWPIEQEWSPNVRRQRRRHEEDAIMKQLEYEGIMKNILPTMSIPLPRDAIVPAKTPYSYAVFPYGASDCSLPILLGCTPKVTYGNVGHQNLAPIPYAHAYRNLGESDKAHDHADIDDEKKVTKH